MCRDDLPPRPLAFERRHAHREPADEGVTGSFIGADGRLGVVPLVVMDVSNTGLGVDSPVEIHPGSVVTIEIPGRRAAAMTTVAVRCERHGARHRVGLLLRQRIAAA